MSKTPSGLIVPAHLAYDLEIKILFNTKTGATELQLHTKAQTLKEINMVHIAGVLAEHTTGLLRSTITGGMKVIHVVPQGGSDGKSS